MPGRLNFGLGNVVDPTQNLSRNLTSLGSQLSQFNARRSREQAQKTGRADKLAQQAAENARADERLSLAKQADARAVIKATQTTTLFDQDQDTIERSDLIGSTDVSGLQTSYQKYIDEVGVENIAPEEISKMRAALQAEADDKQRANLLASDPVQADIAKSRRLQNVQDADMVWNDFAEGIDPGGDRGRATPNIISPEPKTDLLAAANLPRFGTQQTKGLMDRTGAPAPTQEETYLAKQKVLGDKINNAFLALEPENVKINPEDTQKTVTKRTKQTIARNRAVVVKELFKMYKDNVEAKGGTMTAKMEAQIRKTMVAGPMKRYDDQAAATLKDARAKQAGARKAGATNAEKLELYLQKKVVDKKFDKGGRKSGQASDKDIAKAQGIVDSYGDRWSWALGAGMSDQEEADLAAARALLKKSFNY